MKKLSYGLKLALAALLAIAIWEGAWYLLTPSRQHAQYLRDCINTYEEYAEVLNTALPRLRDQAPPAEEDQMILDPLYAYVRGESPDERLIEIPLANFGDFYQNTYSYGLVWAADYDRLLEKNPDMILVSLEDGWCAYANSRPQ